MGKRNREETERVNLIGYATLFALIALFIVFSLTTSQFLKARNILAVIEQISMLCIVSLGLTAACGAGEYDLSLGNVAAFGGVIITTMMTKGFSFPISLIITLIIGAAIGIASGLITTKLRIPSLIVTLGMSNIVYGLIFLITAGKSVYGNLPDSFLQIGAGRVGQVSNLTIIMIVILVFFYILLNKTIFGRYLYASGENPVVTKLSGINSVFYKVMGMVLSSLMATIAGIMLASWLGSGQPTAGSDYSMDSLAAVFIGMTVIYIGKANVLGTLVGVALIGVLNNGLNLLGAPSAAQNIAKGIVMIAAVAIAFSRTKKEVF